jgi:hypothetical protein
MMGSPDMKKADENHFGLVAAGEVDFDLSLSFSPLQPMLSVRRHNRAIARIFFTGTFLSWYETPFPGVARGDCLKSCQ